VTRWFDNRRRSARLGIDHRPHAGRETWSAGEETPVRHLGQQRYRQFLRLPTYLATFSNRPFEAIAPAGSAAPASSSAHNVLLTQRRRPRYADVVRTTRSARLRAARSQHGLYREATSAVTFLTPDTGSAPASASGEVPIGPMTSTSSCLRRAAGDADRYRFRKSSRSLRAVRRTRRTRKALPMGW